MIVQASREDKAASEEHGRTKRSRFESPARSRSSPRELVVTLDTHPRRASPANAIAIAIDPERERGGEEGVDEGEKGRMALAVRESGQQKRLRGMYIYGIGARDDARVNAALKRS